MVDLAEPGVATDRCDLFVEFLKDLFEKMRVKGLWRLAEGWGCRRFLVQWQ